MLKWTIDPEHTVAHFVARHMMVTDVHGQFNGITGTIYFDAAEPDRLTSDIQIDAGMLYTGVDRRDNHLRSADFLDVQRHPRISFKGTSAELTGSNMLLVHGELTIRGITCAIILETEFYGAVQYEDDTGSYTTIGFTATTQINREDFGMTWNHYFGSGYFMAGKHIRLTINGEMDLAGG